MSVEPRRMALLRRHREMAEHHFHQARDRRGIKHPVVFILDLDDPEGRRLAVAFEAHHSGLDESQAAQSLNIQAQAIRRESDIIPALVMVVDRPAACAISAAMTDHGRETIAGMPPDRIPVVVVSAGGNAYAGIPLRPVGT